MKISDHDMAVSGLDMATETSEHLFMMRVQDTAAIPYRRRYLHGDAYTANQKEMVFRFKSNERH